MNSIRMLKYKQAQAERNRRDQERLSQIPESGLAGIAALPVELWGQILEHIFIETHSQWNFRNHGLVQLLHLRLISKTFDVEIKRLLKCYLNIAHLPTRPFLRKLHQPSHDYEAHEAFRDEILASAVYNSVLRSYQYAHQPPITNRIKNCATIAQHMADDHTKQRQRALLAELSAVAAISRSCWGYIFLLRGRELTFVRNIDKNGVPHKMSDIYLEMALLIASGFKKEDVKNSMIELGKMGCLNSYREPRYNSPCLDDGAYDFDCIVYDSDDSLGIVGQLFE